MRCFWLSFAPGCALALGCASNGGVATAGGAGGDTNAQGGASGTSGSGGAGGDAAPTDDRAALVALCQGLCQHYLDVGVSCAQPIATCNAACAAATPPATACIPATENLDRCALMQPTASFTCDATMNVTLAPTFCPDERLAIQNCEAGS